MFVSITRLRVRGWRFGPAFLVLALRSAIQAKRSRGNVAVTVLAEARRTFWTKTVWEDENAMRAFMRGEPHRRAMGKLAKWCNEAMVVHWTQATSDTPSWNEAWRRMQAHGRPSLVERPTAAHTNFQIAEPRVRRIGSELRLK
jgi:heme-degrading monooxygenase HmoA